jgi:hypothetical protein
MLFVTSSGQVSPSPSWVDHLTVPRSKCSLKHETRPFVAFFPRISDRRGVRKVRQEPRREARLRRVQGTHGIQRKEQEGTAGTTATRTTTTTAAATTGTATTTEARAAATISRSR